MFDNDAVRAFASPPQFRSAKCTRVETGSTLSWRDLDHVFPFQVFRAADQFRYCFFHGLFAVPRVILIYYVWIFVPDIFVDRHVPVMRTSSHGNDRFPETSIHLLRSYNCMSLQHGVIVLRNMLTVRLLCCFFADCYPVRTPGLSRKYVLRIPKVSLG